MMSTMDGTDPLHSFGYRFTKDQVDRAAVMKLKKKLIRERSLRLSLTKEVSDLKSTMQSFKSSLIGQGALPPTHSRKPKL